MPRRKSSNFMEDIDCDFLSLVNLEENMDKQRENMWWRFAYEYHLHTCFSREGAYGRLEGGDEWHITKEGDCLD